MKKEKLKLQIGYKNDKYGNQLYDKNGNPIPVFKTIRKLKVMFIDRNQRVSFHWKKPEKHGEWWGYKLFGKYYVIANLDTMIYWTPKIGETPLVITKWCDIEELNRKPECDWIGNIMK